jgi:hypothetical protein
VKDLRFGSKFLDFSILNRSIIIIFYLKKKKKQNLIILTRERHGYESCKKLINIALK